MTLSQPTSGLTLLAAVVVALAVIAYFGFVAHFGVNVPFKDEWSSVALYRELVHGRLSLGSLWAQHNENRILFPNLLMLVLDHVSRVNTQTEMYFSAVLLLLALATTGYLFVRTTHCSLIWFLPSALVLLSWIQYAVALQGFAIALYLLLACLPLSLLALDGSRRHSGLFTLAVALAVVASYSSAQGLAIWVAGLVFLVASGQSRIRCWVWVACGGVTSLVYLVQFQWSAAGGGTGWTLRHPVAALHFLSLLLGGVLPTSHQVGIGIGVQTGVGAALFLLAVGAVVLWIWRRPTGAWLALPLALISFGIVIDVMITAGRAHTVEQSGATSSRYVMFNLWLLGGIWLACASWLVHASGRRIRSLVVVVAALCLLQVALSYHSGLVEGRGTHQLRVRAAALVVHHRTAPRVEVVRLVDPDYADFLRLAAFLEQHRLSVFAARSS